MIVRRSQDIVSNEPTDYYRIGMVMRNEKPFMPNSYRGLSGSRKCAIIIVDWSDVDDCRRHFLLRGSLAVEGRAFTLYEEVDTVKTKEKTNSQLDFMTTLKGMLADDWLAMIVFDAGGHSH